jgi:hypothetical protein
MRRGFQLPGCENDGRVKSREYANVFELKIHRPEISLNGFKNLFAVRFSIFKSFIFLHKQ